MTLPQISSRTGLSLILLATLLIVLLAAPQPVKAVPPEIGSLRTDGNTVVWVQSHHENAVYVARDDQESSRQIADGPGVGSYVDVSGDRVVWSENDRLIGIDLETDEPLDLPMMGGPTAQEGWPSISGSRLVWFNRADPTASWQLLTVDLSGSEPPNVIATIPQSNERLHRPVVTGDRIVWGVSSGEGVGWNWELWTAQVGENPIKLASGTTDLNLSGYDVAGNTVVYAADEVVYVLDVRALGAGRVLSMQGRDPTTDGRYVFWADWQWRARITEQRLGYDLATDSYVGPELRTDTIHRAFWTRAGVVAIATQSESAGLSVELAPVRAMLPSASFEDPGMTSPTWLYFDTTGHYLSYGFKDFWVRSGGLPVFGYPMTSEYDEFNQDLGEFRTVQYTERQRFEYHPAYAGSPYETSLGRLGAADAERRGFDDHPAFARVSRPTSADVEYFDVTGHTLRGRFREYWNSHGLEFGDAGVSYRESLALFGYPISEEFVDSDTGLVTQYFERAVFEHHPDNPDPYKVLLRRLGAEEIERRDW